MIAVPLDRTGCRSGSDSVFGLAGDYRAHAAAGISDIPRPARDQMHVAVKDRLTGNRADIDADVETADRRVAKQDVESSFLEQLVDRTSLVGLELEIIG